MTFVFSRVLFCCGAKHKEKGRMSAAGALKRFAGQVAVITGGGRGIGMRGRGDEEGEEKTTTSPLDHSSQHSSDHVILHFHQSS